MCFSLLNGYHQVAKLKMQQPVNFIFRDGAICEVSTAHLKGDTLVQVITLRSVWDGVSEYD